MRFACICLLTACSLHYKLEGSVNLDKGAQAEQQSEEVTSGKGTSKRSARKSSDSKVCASQLSQC